jgi:hypothetical protein
LVSPVTFDSAVDPDDPPAVVHVVPLDASSHVAVAGSNDCVSS